MMTPELRQAWEADVAICHAGLDSARVRSATAEIAIFEARLDALGALPPAEDDIEALLEPEAHAWGINGAEYEAEVARLKKKHDLGDDLKPRATPTRRTTRS